MQNPDISRGLEQGVLNLSAVARLICGSRSNEFDAVLAALKRSSRRRNKVGRNAAYTTLLRNARLVVRSGLVVVAFKRSNAVETALSATIDDRSSDVSTIVAGHNMISVTCTDEEAARIRRTCARWFVEETRNLAQLTLLSSPLAVRTIGFAAYTTSLLSAQSINIHAEATCAGEHLIVIAENDLQRAISALTA